MAKQFLDYKGLQTYDGLIKKHIDEKTALINTEGTNTEKGILSLNNNKLYCNELSIDGRTISDGESSISFNIDPQHDIIAHGDLTVIGDLTVNGETITVDQENVLIKQALTVINADKIESTTPMGTIIRAGQEQDEITGEQKNIDYGIIYEPGDDLIKIGKVQYNEEDYSIDLENSDLQPIATRAFEASDDSTLAVWNENKNTLEASDTFRSKSSIISSENSVAIGVNNIAGLTGLAIHRLQSHGYYEGEYSTLEFFLSDNELAEPSDTELVKSVISKWNEGDIVTIFYRYNFYNCGSIIEIDTFNLSVKVSLPPNSDVRWSEVIDATLDPETDTNGFFNMSKQNIKGPWNGATGCVAFGANNKSLAYCAFVAGGENLGYGKYSAIFGRGNSGGYASLVSGKNNKIFAEYSSAVSGHSNTIDLLDDKGENSSNCTVGGVYNELKGYANTSFGSTNKVSDSYNFAANYNNVVGGVRNFVANNTNKVSGTDNFVANYDNDVTGTYNAVFGQSNVTNNSDSVFITGTGNEITTDATWKAMNSVVHGEGNTVGNELCLVQGYKHTINGSNIVAFGVRNTSDKDSSKSLIIGENNTIQNVKHTFVSGRDSQVKNTERAIIGGYATRADKANNSITGGIDTVINHSNCIICGSGLTSCSDNQAVFGKYNQTGDYLFAIGCGSNDANRKNAFHVDKDGNAYANGKKLVNGINETDLFAMLNEEMPIGHTVSIYCYMTTGYPVYFSKTPPTSYDDYDMVHECYYDNVGPEILKGVKDKLYIWADEKYLTIRIGSENGEEVANYGNYYYDNPLVLDITSDINLYVAAEA